MSHSRRSFLRGGLGAVGAAGVGGSFSTTAAAEESPLREGAEDRAYWIETTEKLADPILTHLARGELKQDLPVEDDDRRPYAPLEAFGRLMTGVAPWLELGDDGTEEGARRGRMAERARAALAMAVDPSSPDFMNFTEGSQPLVDAAFLAQAVLRAPTELWEKVPFKTRSHLVQALISTRRITPYYNNWILFSAMIEAMLRRSIQSWDEMRVRLALRTVEEWYVGDGLYGDGPRFHWDYYNSYVIQPFLLDILGTLLNEDSFYMSQGSLVRIRARRYAAILERLISPEGTYPPVGRSLAYRFGAFQLLSQMALLEDLPAEVSPAQVRSALTMVIRRQMTAPGTFDSEGWLTVGLSGRQPGLGEGYICVGSTYLCAAGLLALGLPAESSFWSGPGEGWTSRKIWSGQDLPADHALRE